ncbi:MAG: type IV secretion system DNA-binding domain-containing protein [Deltaproteobacteria bacterium]|nr:type IV secretion system DNA-binding domain-containing protein [Deltaproteobacteria bacterium]MBI3390325.1 type IV secretion system DNA-binding domain-containing protein [Deltaproteobacteria bacterium]
MIRADNDVARFARTNFRNERKVFGIKRADRRAHMYVVGQTGTGKSTLIETLISQDLESGEGLVVFDPHGDLIQRVLSRVPEHRREELIYFNAPEPEQPLGFNPLERVPESKRPLAASAVLDAFRKLWEDSWGPRMEHILRNALLGLLDQPSATLADVLPLLMDRNYRRAAIRHMTNQQVRAFWSREYEGYPPYFRASAIAPIQNKIGAFLADPLLHKILAGSETTLNLREIMDERKILLVDLAKGKMGGDASALLGALLVASVGWSAFGRAEVPEKDRADFYVYLDEFHTFASLSLASMLSELRKYRVGLILAHQYVGQLEPPMRDAVFGNVGTIISFRVGLDDAKVLAREFYPEFAEIDLISLPNHRIYLKLMIDGTPSKPFSADTLPPED